MNTVKIYHLWNKTTKGKVTATVLQKKTRHLHMNQFQLYFTTDKHDGRLSKPLTKFSKNLKSNAKLSLHLDKKLAILFKKKTTYKNIFNIRASCRVYFKTWNSYSKDLLFNVILPLRKSITSATDSNISDIFYY